MKPEDSFARAIVGFPTTSDPRVATNVKSVLRHLDGIISFTFDSANDKVDMVFDPNKVNLNMIKKAIAEASVVAERITSSLGATAK